MTGFRVINLLMLLEELGEDECKSILSEFSCPLNGDVEAFLRDKAIPFARQRWAQTHLVFASYQQKWVLVGYYTLANKTICIRDSSLKKHSGTLRKRISRFASHDHDAKAYILSAPLIGQLGKNYNHGYDSLITGDELLSEACRHIGRIQYNLGGRFAYLECEDNPKLIEFYASNGFCAFQNRMLDADETNLNGEYLVQMIKYIRS